MPARRSSSMRSPGRCIVSATACRRFVVASAASSRISQTPSDAAAWRASSIASRVLPTPACPASVTRAFCSSCAVSTLEIRGSADER